MLTFDYSVGISFHFLSLSSWPSPYSIMVDAGDFQILRLWVGVRSVIKR